MVKSASERRTRSDKFPLTLHKTGQYCKKIRGRIYYFGTDKRRALERYHEQAASLHAGRPVTARSTSDQLSIKTMCNLYLDHQESRVTVGDVKPRHVSDQVSLLRAFVRFAGAQRLVSDITTLDLQNYRTKLVRAGNSANTVNNRIAAVKAMYNWALDNELIDRSPRLRALKKVTPQKAERPTFTASQIWTLLEDAGVQMRGMIWLGLNCGFGCTDCAELRWKNLDLVNARVTFPRGKTGIGRNLPLWPETVQALQAVPNCGELVFHTHSGNPWVRTISSRQEDGTTKYTKDDAVTKEFAKLMKKAKIEAPKGAGSAHTKLLSR
jgi:integrase